jgi:hypothetical protein
VLDVAFDRRAELRFDYLEMRSPDWVHDGRFGAAHICQITGCTRVDLLTPC